jgi:hypothetical protein
MHEYVVRSLAPMTMAELEGVAADTRMSKWTIQKIRLRQIENPGVKSVQILYDALKLRESKRRRVA